MRRISITLAIALSILLPIPICSAQQTALYQRPNSQRDVSPMGPIIGGDGIKNYIPIWSTPNYLQSSAIYQDANKNVGVGTTTPAAKLDVNGDINVATTYEIGGFTVLGIGGQSGDANVFLGVYAGSNNVAGKGFSNVFLGYAAGNSNTTGADNTFTGYAAGVQNTTGEYNTFAGVGAGSSNTTGGYNTFTGGTAGGSNTVGNGNTLTGWAAGFGNTSGIYNTFAGFKAGYFNTTGSDNVFTGLAAGYANTTGSDNTFTGDSAGYMNTTGGNNTFTGAGAGSQNTSGNNNIFMGYNAGVRSATGSNDIYMGNFGSSSGDESNAIRIGDPTVHAVAYMAGIYGSTASGGVPVYVNSNGQLGTSGSALRFKEQVRDMGDSTNALMKLRPVTFFYKPEYGGERTMQYGLIAEEVAKVYPELVAYDKDGQPYSVRYQYLTTMLLNEAQKQYRRAEEEAKVIQQLEERLLRLEQLVGSQLEVIAQK